MNCKLKSMSDEGPKIFVFFHQALCLGKAF